MARVLDPAFLDLLARMLSESPDAVRVVGRDGTVLVRNRAALAFPPDGLGHLCMPPMRARPSSCPGCRLEVSLRDGAEARWHVKLPSHAGTGRERCYEITLWPARDEMSQVFVVVEVTRDMTATLGLEHYLIRTAEAQEEEIRQKTDEARLLVESAETLRTELGCLRDSQTELVYHDRLLALGLLVSALAHEIHTPLAAVAANSDLVRRHMDRLRGAFDAVGSSATQRLDALQECSEVISEGARRIQGVVRTLQIFSRSDEAERKAIDLHESLDCTLALLGYRIGPGIRLVREYGALPPVACRPDAVNHVFLTVLLNAVQSIRSEGQIRIRTRCEGRWSVVEIEDDGDGIAPEVLPRIFELGFTTRGPGVGSGIGLALARRIVDEHGGGIEAASGPGRGSTFTIRLPVAGGEPH